jgi:myo-inositol-1(or 4)-monophosphatase
MDLEEIREVGVDAARRGADVLQAYFDADFDVKKKSAIELVTTADIESEKAIIAAIRKAYPAHSIIAEESGREQGRADRQWIIDPLDGTTNYARHIPIYSISIAFAANGQTGVGIVLVPATNELFVAVAGQGATLNGRAIEVSDTKALSESLLVTGFPYDFKENLAEIACRFNGCLQASMGIRRLGSAALDLCYVACGRFDGFWEQNLKPWDTAAGACIAAEAGAQVTDFSGRPYTHARKEILATNRLIHDKLVSLLAV